MLNMSMEMFGNSINLLEVGGRVQGLESILEKFFGPNGYFTKDQAKELMDNKRQTANYVSPFDTMVSVHFVFELYENTRNELNLT